MPKIADINPIGSIARPIGGTDLGIPFHAFDKLAVLFGDTFGRFQGRLEQRIAGDDWRSPVIVWMDRRTDAAAKMKVSGAVLGGAQLWEYPHNNPEFSTVLPTDGIEIDGRVYIWVMVTAGLGNERWCELVYTDDRGATWRNTGHLSTSAFRGMRVMLTFDRKPGSDIIDIFSTGGLKRDKGMLRWRAHKNDFLDVEKWQAWCYLNGKWQWVTNAKNDQPSEILPGRKFGEIDFNWIQGNAVLAGFESSDYSAFIKVGENTDADWTRAPTYRPVTGLPRGVDTVAQLYGCYVDPESRFDGNFGLIVSQWKTDTGIPYRAMQYQVFGVKPVTALDNTPRSTYTPPPTPVTPPAPAPTPTPVPDPPKEGPTVTQPTQGDAERVVGAGETTTRYDEGNPNLAKPGLNLWGASKRILFELTLWTQRLTPAELRSKDQQYAQTTHGHARDAASWGRSLDADVAKVLRNQAKIGAALKLTDLEK